MSFRIERIELYDLVLPLEEPFIISGGVMRERRSVVVLLHDGEGAVGYGESPPFELPFYSEETLVGARDLIERVLAPRVLHVGFDDLAGVDATLRPGIRGNPFARAAIETAAWDLEADRRGVGLAHLVAERAGETAAPDVSCGVALGIPEDHEPGTLTRWVRDAVARGYRRVKIKVMPGWDGRAVDAARAGLDDADLPLTVDANGAYEWPLHESNLRRLDAAGLLYIEQPLHPDELVGHAHLAAELDTPICLDETLRDARAARQTQALDGPKVWNVKVHRVGGLTEACRIYDVAREYGATLWAGTMPESGIGSQAALAAAALPRFSYPSDLEPSARWFGDAKDVIELTMTRRGTMHVPGESIRHLLDHDRFRHSARRFAVLA